MENCRKKVVDEENSKEASELPIVRLSSHMVPEESCTQVPTEACNKVPEESSNQEPW